MTKSKFWKLCPLPPNWEEKYDAGAKLHYYIDHANRRTTWTDPRSWYYEKDRISVVKNTSIQELSAGTPSDGYENLQESYDGLARNESVRLTCAAKTNSIVKNFLSEEHDLKLNQRHKRSRYSSSTTRKSTSRKHIGHDVESQSFSTPSSVVVPSSASNQQKSPSPQSRSRDVISLDTGSRKKKDDIPSTVSSSPKPDSQLESRGTADNPKSVPEVEEMVPSTSMAKPYSQPDETIEPQQATPSGAKQASESRTTQTETQKVRLAFTIMLLINICLDHILSGSVNVEINRLIATQSTNWWWLEHSSQGAK